MKLLDAVDRMLQDDPTIMPYNKAQRIAIYNTFPKDVRGRVTASAEIASNWIHHRKAEKFMAFSSLFTFVASTFLSYSVGQDRMYQVVKHYAGTIEGKFYPQVTEIITIDPASLNRLAEIATLGYVASALMLVGFFIYRAEVLKRQDAASKATRQVVAAFRIGAQAITKKRGQNAKGAKDEDLALEQFDDAFEE